MRERMTRTDAEALQQSRERAERYVPNRTEYLRVLRIAWEFITGFHLLKDYCLAVTFFGTSRCSFGDEVYTGARELARRLSEEGFAVISGGGPGVMRAANHGAHDAGGASIGINIEIPAEQKPNEYQTDSGFFKYFFVRKVLLAFASEAYVFFPGGFGTMDEFFEIVTLIQTKKIQPIPVVLVGKEYWTPLLEWIDQTLYEKNHAINEDDMQIYHLVDSVDEAYEYILGQIFSERATAC